MAAHNTVRIDGSDQGLRGGTFRWTQKPEGKLLEFANDMSRDSAVAICYYRGFTHTRSVEFGHDEFSHGDQIEGTAGEHDTGQFWHSAFEPRELRDLGGRRHR